MPSLKLDRTVTSDVIGEALSGTTVEAGSAGWSWGLVGDGFHGWVESDVTDDSSRFGSQIVGASMDVDDLG